MRQPARGRIRFAIIVMVWSFVAAVSNPSAIAATSSPLVASLTATPATGTAPITITFDASASVDTGGQIVSYKFDFDNGTPNVTTSAPNAASTYTMNGQYTVKVTVTDDSGRTAAASVGVQLTDRPTTTVSPPPIAGVATSDVGVPADVLDLANWKVTLPISTKTPGKPDEIVQPQLARFVLPPYFAVNPAETGVVFVAPVAGVTTSNSGYPRSELREMNGLTEASWSNTAGTHTMVIREAIAHLPVVKPQVVAGQIHDADDDVVMVRLEGINLFLEHDGANLGTLNPNYRLGTIYRVKLVAANGHIKVFYNGRMKVDFVHSGSGWYFKAGAYTQSNPSKGDAPDAYGEVVIYRLTITHT
jgi:PKD repeat protein